MRVDRDTFPEMTARGQVVTAGTLWLGHPRRCPRLFLETPLYLGESCRLEVGFVGMGTQVGNDTWVRRCRRIGRFSVIGERCRIGAAYGADTGELPVCAMIRSRQGWWGDAVRTEHPVLSEKRPPTVIGNDVWIGDGAVILEGVTVGDGAVIAPLALVAASVPEGALVCGNPGHIAGYRYEKAFPWWNYGSALLEKTDFSLLSGREDFSGTLPKWPGIRRRYLWRERAFCCPIARESARCGGRVRRERNFAIRFPVNERIAGLIDGIVTVKPEG